MPIYLGDDEIDNAIGRGILPESRHGTRLAIAPLEKLDSGVGFRALSVSMNKERFPRVFCTYEVRGEKESLLLIKNYQDVITMLEVLEFVKCEMEKGRIG